MANGHDNSPAPRRKLLGPVMVVLLAGTVGLAWWYAHRINLAKRRAGAAVVAEVRKTGIGSYVRTRAGVVRWFRSSALTQMTVRTPAGGTFVHTGEKTTGWQAELMLAYPDGTYGGLDMVLNRDEAGAYDGYWRRWRLTDDMTAGEVHGGPLAVRGDLLEVTGGLLAEITADEIVIHHSKRTGEVRRYPAAENFLPTPALPSAMLVVHDRQTTGLFELLELGAADNGWPVGPSRMMLSRANVDAPPAWGAVGATVTMRRAADGVQLADIYLDAGGGVLAVDRGAEKDLLAAAYLGNMPIALGPDRAAPPGNLLEVFNALVGHSGVRDSLRPSEVPAE